MSTEKPDVETLVRKARAIVNMVMENLGTGHDATDDTEYALWTVSDLLSQVERHLEESSEWSDLGEDELAVQNKGRTVFFDDILPEDRIDIGVTPDGVTLTTLHGEIK
jgi:hypothetical protein